MISLLKTTPYWYKCTMAEGGQLSLNSFKKQFGDQVTCSVCLDQYTNPKTLPCHHSFCLHCIKQLPVEIKDRKYYISCPICAVDHLLPRGGANSLPSAFHINSLIDLWKKLVTAKTTTPNQSTCPKHNNLDMTVYCETCCQVICRDCTISTEHNKHTFYLISECYPKHHQQIQGNLDLVKRKLDDMNAAMIRLDTGEREVLEQGENIKEQINTHAQQLIHNIKQSRTHLIQQVDTIVELKRQTLAIQRQQAQEIHTQLKTCQDMIEHSLKEWNQQRILSQKITIMDEMKTATQHVDPAVFQPIEDANIQYHKTKKEMGSITRIAYGKATLEVSPCTAKQHSTATLTLHSQDGSPFSLPPSLISSRLSTSGNKHTEKCPITQTQPGKYSIRFKPSTRNDQLVVQVGGVKIPDSPFTLPVIALPEMRREPLGIITGLNRPHGIAVCDNGDIVVAEHGADCITILDKKGEKIKSFGQFNDPRGVAVSTDGHILVTDNHRLLKLTTDGVCLKSVGSSKSGSGQLQFYCPTGIAVHSITGQIFVSDRFNRRIQVFHSNLTFSHCISPTWLSLSPVFEYSLHISIDNDGHLYVIDNVSPCIFKLNAGGGEVIKTFGSTPYQKETDSCSLTSHNNLVFVCQYNKDGILVFNTDGNFQYRLGEHSKLDYSLGISTDALGNLYISDIGNNRIVII